jgi:glycosyltransferase involved in cell wall biosynthesis
MSRLLQISTYPTLAPRHGGQRRAHQIGRALERAGHEVRRVAAYDFAPYHGQPSEPAIDLGRLPPPTHPAAWLFEGARALAQDPMELAAFSRLCEPADAIVLEEVWLWPVVRTLPGVRSGALPVIYSGHNIEAPVFARSMRGFGHPRAEEYGAEVAAMEAELAGIAAGASAVTDADARALRRLGARRVVVAPNGVEARDRSHLAGAIPEALAREHRFLLFVASAHPPNASGVPDLFMALLTVLRPLERLVVAGGVCHLLREWLQGGPTHLARGRLILMGELSDFCLDGLFANAAAIVLPLRDGGGSNLKTAEALYSRLPMVATSTAMRGFEDYVGDPGVVVTDEPSAFAAAVRDVLDTPPPSRMPGPRLDRLLWDSTLCPLVAMVDEVLDERAREADGRHRLPPGPAEPPGERA